MHKHPNYRATTTNEWATKFSNSEIMLFECTAMLQSLSQQTNEFIYFLFFRFPSARIMDMGNSRMVTLKPAQLAQTLIKNSETIVYGS